MKDGEVKNKLSPAQVSVMRHKVTEPPYFGKYWDHFEAGTYSCAACDTVLFGSSDKFDSKSGWPTFRKPLNERNLEFKGEAGPDDKVELRCKKCKSHLGYVISGDQPYYRINSVCLNFEEEVIPEIELPETDTTKEEAKNEKKDNTPTRPEFPLPPPAITLIDDTIAPGWSTGTVLAAAIAGLLIGAAAMFWYTAPAALPADTATSTPETATSTPDTPADTEPEEPVTPAEIIRPSATEPTLERTPAEAQLPPSGAADGATSTQ